MNIGRYEIQRELGRGGMAAVYHAYDPRFRREVAIKVLPRELLFNPQFRARFEREAQTIATLEHPAIVPVYDYGEDDGQLYLVMRLMSGGSLADHLHERGALPLSEVVEIIERLAPALDVAHKRGVVHRDLKPGNILFDQYGNACLSDFGIVKLAEETSGLTGSGIIGTPAYMSPEQINSDSSIDGRSDIYAMGVILYEMLTGRYPYQAETPMRLAMKHLTEPIPRLTDARPDLPRALNTVILTALAKERTQRFATASEMITQLRSAAAHGHEIPISAPYHTDDPTTLDSHLPPADVTYDHPAASVSSLDADTLAESDHSIPAPPPTNAVPRRSSLRPMLIGIPIVLVITAGIVLAMMMGNPFTPSPETTPTSEPSEVAPTDDLAAINATTTPAMAAAPTDPPDQPTETGSPTLEAASTEPTATPISLDTASQITPLHTIDLGTASVGEIEWQPNGTMIAVGIFDRPNETTILYDGSTGEEIRRFSGAGYYPAWSPDGTLLGTSTGSGQVTIWDIATFQPIRAFNPGGHFGAWSYDGTLFAFGGDARGAALIWDSASDENNAEIGFFDLVHAYDMVWSPTRNQVALAGQGFYLWDEQNGLVLQSNAISAPVYSASWSPDGQQIALGQNNGLLLVWNVTLEARIMQLNITDSNINSVSWSPDGTMLVTVTYDGDLMLIDAQTGDIVHEIAVSEYGRGAAWSPDMTRIAAGTLNSLNIWGITP